MAVIKSRSYGTLTGSTATHYGNGSPPTVVVRTGDIGRADLNISANGYPHPHPFESTDSQVTGSITNGVQAPNRIGDYASAKDAPSYFYANKQTRLIPVSIAGMGARLLAATNPTRADVLLPVAFFELREIPMMIHQAGNILLNPHLFDRFGFGKLGRYNDKLSPTQRIASATLAYNFGWAPLVSDLTKLLSFKDSVDKRMKEWDRLYSGSGLKRRLKLGSESMEGSKGSTYGYPSSTLTVVPKHYRATNTYWGTVRWKPAAPSPYFSRPTPNQVRRMILGLSAENIAANVWEALPWSWLIDWCTGTQNVLVANQGKGYAVPHGGCVMCRQESVEYHEQRTSQWGAPGYELTLSAGEFRYRKHFRFLATGSLTAQLPFLNGSTLSILSSLAVTRARWAR